MLFSQLSVQGLLSFGTPGITLKLRPLNVLIGPNGTGKSNLLEIVRLLKSLPTGMSKVLQQGGPGEWLHDGQELDAFVRFRLETAIQPMAGSMELASSTGRWGEIVFESLRIASQQIDDSQIDNSQLEFEPQVDFFERSGSSLLISQSAGGQRVAQAISTSQSATYRKSSVYELIRGSPTPEITSVAEQLSQIRLYRDWSFGPSNRLRHGFRADELSGDFLEEDASNLASVLHEMRTDREAWDRLLRALRNLYEGCEDIHVSFAGGFVQLHVLEGEKRRKVPASRLSDGTLRYLMLVTLLCHPKPPPLICIEEPELGLHPDLMITIAELLREASTRTQLIVTTHSEALVDALGDQPEDIVVCERGEQGSTMRRLDEVSLREWLKNYSLGQLWRRGDIGGNRW